MKSVRQWPLALAAGLGLLLLGQASSASRWGVKRVEAAARPFATCTWNGSAGDWTDPMKWTACGGSVPGAGDTALISGGTVTVSTNVTVGTLQLTGGTLDGAGALTVNTAMTWGNATMKGAGSTNIAAGATLNLTATSFEILDGRTVNNAGTANLSGTGTFALQNQGVFNNLASGVFNLQSAAPLQPFGAGPSIFNNAGTVRKAVGGSNSINVVFNNTNVVDLQTGTLIFTGISSSSGPITLGAGALLTIDGSTFTLNAGAAINGTGTFQTTQNGTLSVEGNVACAAAFNHGGLLNGAGAFTVTGSYNWTAGNMNGTGSTTIPAGATLAITGASPKTLDGRTLNLAGTANLSSTSLTISNHGTLNNQVGAVFAFSAGGIGNGTSDPTNLFNNAGTLRKTDNGTTIFTAVLNNNGTVELQAGALSLNNGGVSSGLMNVAAGATLTFNSNYALNTGAALNGAGAYQLNSATLSLAGNVSCAAAFTQNGGTLTGAGNFTANGAYNWSSGTMSGAGSTNISASGTLNLTGTSKTLDGRTLNNAGTATLGNSFSLTFANQATFNNLAGALFNFQNDVAIVAGSAQPGVFNNAGTVRKTSGTSTNLSVPFNNNNLVEVLTGDFQLSAGGAVSGPVNVSAGAQFKFVSGTVTLNTGALLNGPGTFQLNNATLDVTANLGCAATFVQTGGTLTGAGAFTVNATYNWQGGTMSGTGSTNIAAGATLNLTTAANHGLDGRSLNNAGTTALSESGGLALQNQGVFNNLAGGVFLVQSDADIGGGTFNNAGLWRKTAVGDTRFEGAVFNNNGTVEIQFGTLTLNGGGASGSSFSVNNAATLAFNNNYTLNTGAALNGTGVYQLTGGTLNVAGNSVCNAVFNHNGGTLGGAGTFTANNVYNWLSGVMSGSGVTLIPAAATLNLTTNGSKTLDTRTLNNAGAALMNNTGFFGLANNAILNNQAGALFEIQTAGGISVSGSFTPVAFNNQGSVRKTAAGDTNISVAFNNSNQVEIMAGALTFGQFTQTDGSTVMNGGALNFTLAGQLQGGTLTGAGTITGSLNNSGGTVAPGLSPGLLTITGTYAQGATGKLNIELGGTTAGTQYDRLVAGGTVALGGTLNVTTLNGFVPAFGNNFVIATFASRTGTFSTLNLPNGLPAFHTATSVVLGGCPTTTVTPATLLDGTAGTAYNQTMSVTGSTAGTVFTVSGGVLPAGLSLSAAGVLSGTPTAVGLASFTVQAIAPTGCLGERAYALTINPTCPTTTIAPATLPNSFVGANYTQQLTVTGGTAGTVFSVVAGALPNGLALSHSGLLSGTLTTSGQFSFTVRAVDANGCLGERAYSTLTIGPACPTTTIAPATLPSGTAGTSYNQQLTVTGGTGSTAFSIASGTLPAGLSLSAAGVLSGTPTVSGQFTFTVRAIDAGNCRGERAYTLTLNAACATITVNPATLPDATSGVNYNQQLSASGGTGPYSFALQTSTLPTGLTLSTAGVLSGTPPQTGSASFTVKATDASGCTGTRAYTLTISCPTITVNPATLPNARLGLAYQQTLTQTGGAGAITWSLSGGALPNGLTLAANGQLSGVLTLPGVFNFTVKATDAAGCFATQSYTVVIARAVKGDFDNDGKTDLGVFRPAAVDPVPNWLALKSSTAQALNFSWGGGYAPYNDVPVPGDYDGDGKTDYAIWRGADTFWYIRRSSDGQAMLIFYGANFAPYYDIPTPGDFDGDGKTDIAVYRRSGTWFVRRSSDGEDMIIQHGQQGDVPLAADFDGDGKCDFGLFRPEAVAPAPNWIIRQSSTGTVVGLQWGGGYAPYYDVPVPADYDGDGKADLAIWRGQDTIWYIRPSATPNAPILELWGANYAPYFDIPSPADYDGDGKADIAVWRKDGTWYIKRSTNGANLIQVHGQQGDLPVPANGVR